MNNCFNHVFHAEMSQIMRHTDSNKCGHEWVNPGSTDSEKDLLRASRSVWRAHRPAMSLGLNLGCSQMFSVYALSQPLRNSQNSWKHQSTLFFLFLLDSVNHTSKRVCFSNEENLALAAWIDSTGRHVEVTLTSVTEADDAMEISTEARSGIPILTTPNSDRLPFDDWEGAADGTKEKQTLKEHFVYNSLSVYSQQHLTWPYWQPVWVHHVHLMAQALQCDIRGKVMEGDNIIIKETNENICLLEEIEELFHDSQRFPETAKTVL